MTSLEAQRQFFSEEIRMCSNIQSAALVEALALVAREQFLPPGPWTIRGEGDMGPARQTRDADPRHVYHNISIAIDAARQLYNGAPGTVAPWIDWLGLKPGGRVLHVGCGLGYYTAIMAHVVGSTGYIRALEVDEALAQQAKRNLMPLAWVDARRGDGGETPDLAFDAVLIHAGVTHPLPAWLDALVVGGRMVFPLTATVPQMGAVGKGWTFVLTKKADGSFEAHPGNLVAIYSAAGIRDETLNPAIGAALTIGPFPMVRRLRRDPHSAASSCWLHGPTFCLAA